MSLTKYLIKEIVFFSYLIIFSNVCKVIYSMVIFICFYGLGLVKGAVFTALEIDGDFPLPLVWAPLPLLSSTVSVVPLESSLTTSTFFEAPQEKNINAIKLKTLIFFILLILNLVKYR